MHILYVARGGTLIQHLRDAVGQDGHVPDLYRTGLYDVHVLCVEHGPGPWLGVHAEVFLNDEAVK